MFYSINFSSFNNFLNNTTINTTTKQTNKNTLHYLNLAIMDLGYTNSTFSKLSITQIKILFLKLTTQRPFLSHSKQLQNNIIKSYKLLITFLNTQQQLTKKSTTITKITKSINSTIKQIKSSKPISIIKSFINKIITPKSNIIKTHQSHLHSIILQFIKFIPINTNLNLFKNQNHQL